jgi:uncharacterized protein YbaP (TraB family)
MRGRVAPGGDTAAAWITLVAALLVSFAAVPAGARDAPVSVRDAPASAGNPPVSGHEPHHIFWAVQGKHNTVYLLGSIHALKPADAVLPAQVLRAYESAQMLVLEVPFDDLTGGGLMRSMLDHGVLPKDQTLATALGPDIYAQFSARAWPLGLDPAYLSHFQPWYAALTLEQLALAKEGFEANSGVDMQLGERARADHKQITGLETIDDQLKIFSGLSPPQQRQFMLYTIDDVDDVNGQVNTLVAAWRDGDTARLGAVLGRALVQFPDLYQALVTDRNHKWMAGIEALLNDEHDCLVVVGALHLVGRDGVVELLRQQGYRPVQH